MKDKKMAILMAVIFVLLLSILIMTFMDINSYGRLSLSEDNQQVESASSALSNCDSDSNMCAIFNTEVNSKESEISDLLLTVHTDENNCVELHIKSSYIIASAELQLSKDVNITELKGEVFNVRKKDNKLIFLRKIDDALQKAEYTDLDMCMICFKDADIDLASIFNSDNFIFFEYGTGTKLQCKVEFK